MTPADVDIDYLWLSPELSLDGGLDAGIRPGQTAAPIKVLQTFNAGLDNPALQEDLGSRRPHLQHLRPGHRHFRVRHRAGALRCSSRSPSNASCRPARQWQRTPFREINRTNWLIVGFGPIGRATAARAKAFGANITVVRRSPETGPIVDRAGTMGDLPAILPDIDVIVLACPLNETTRGFAGKDVLRSRQAGRRSRQHRPWWSHR